MPTVENTAKTNGKCLKISKSTLIMLENLQNSTLGFCDISLRSRYFEVIPSKNHEKQGFFINWAALQYHNLSSYTVDVLLGARKHRLMHNTTFRNPSLSISLTNHGWLEPLLQGREARRRYYLTHESTETTQIYLITYPHVSLKTADSVPNSCWGTGYFRRIMFS